MQTFPTELWSMILDIVVEEGIIRMDHCDHTTFPYMLPYNYTEEYRYRFCDTYIRLRLVCRSFNALLSSSPQYFLMKPNASSIPATTKALFIGLSEIPVTSLPQPSQCQHLVYLDVRCSLWSWPDEPDLFDFLHASDSRSLGHVRRLTLRTHHYITGPRKLSFWSPLQQAFPLLVTLKMTIKHSSHTMELKTATDGDVTFERLEILYLGSGIVFHGLTLPRLRHASVDTCPYPGLKALQRSPYLESLLIRSAVIGSNTLDIRLFPNLRLLGFREEIQRFVVPMNRDHPLEHVWLFGASMPGEPEEYCIYEDHGLIEGMMSRFPGSSRLTVDLSSMLWNQEERTKEFRKLEFASIGLSMRPPTYDGDPIVNIEYAIVKAGS